MSFNCRWLVLALVVATFFVPLGAGPFSEPDEARYAEISREMLATGDWVTPRLNGVPYFVKPPLLFWLTASSFRVLGETESAARLVSALAGAGCVGASAWLASMIFGAETGLLAALILATTPLFVAFSQVLTPDVLLTAWITLATGCFLAALRGGGRYLVLIGSVGAAMATLTKGFVGIALPLAVTLGAVAFERRWRDLWRWEWVLGGASFIALVLPWFVIVALRNPEFLWAFFVYEHWMRYASTAHHRGGSVFYYVPILLAGTLPWSLCAATALGARLRDRSGIGLARDVMRVAGPWVLIPLVFFSLAGSKLPGYVLPALPPLAILLAGFGERLVSKTALALWLALVAVAAAAAVAIVLFPPSPLPRGWPPLARSLLPEIALLGLLGLTSSMASLWALRWRESRRVPVAFAVGLAVLFMIAASRRALVPNERALALAVAANLPAGGRVVSYSHYIYAIPFYAHVRESVVRLPPWLNLKAHPGIDAELHWKTKHRLLTEWGSGGPLLVVIKRRDLERLRPAMAPEPRIIGEFGKHLLVANWDEKEKEEKGVGSRFHRSNGLTRAKTTPDPLFRRLALPATV